MTCSYDVTCRKKNEDLSFIAAGRVAAKSE